MFIRVFARDAGFWTVWFQLLGDGTPISFLGENTGCFRFHTVVRKLHLGISVGLGLD